MFQQFPDDDDDDDDDVIYIEPCRDQLYNSLCIIYIFFVYELVKQLFDSYIHSMESYKFIH
jgi:hypothetical protein